MQQIIETLAKMQEKADANQAKADANLKELKEEIKTNQMKTEENRKSEQEHKQGMLARMDANQERMNASLREEIQSGEAEMRSTVSALEKKMDALIADMKGGQKERTACHKEMEANPKKMEPNPEIMQSEAEHQEVPKECAMVKLVRGLSKGHRGWNLAEEHHGQPKEWTWRHCESWKKLAAAKRKMTCHAGVAQRKGCSHEELSVDQGQRKNQTRNKFARGTQKGQMPRRRQLMHQEGANGTRNRDFKEQLCLGS
jgi:hypothetical protein